MPRFACGSSAIASEPSAAFSAASSWACRCRLPAFRESSRARQSEAAQVLGFDERKMGERKMIFLSPIFLSTPSACRISALHISVRCRCPRAMHVPQVRAGDLLAADHPHHLPLLQIGDDRQGHARRFPRRVPRRGPRCRRASAAGRRSASGPRPPAAAQVPGVSGLVRLLQVDHPQQTVLRADDRQHRVVRSVETIQHHRQRVARLNAVEHLLANQELADVDRFPAPRGRNSLDGPESGSGSPLAWNRSISRPRAGTPARRPTAPAGAGGSRPSSR